MNLEKKYLKYKLKYFELKKNLNKMQINYKGGIDQFNTPQANLNLNPNPDSNPDHDPNPDSDPEISEDNRRIATNLLNVFDDVADNVHIESSESEQTNELDDEKYLTSDSNFLDYYEFNFIVEYKLEEDFKDFGSTINLEKLPNNNIICVKQHGIIITDENFKIIKKINVENFDSFVDNKDKIKFYINDFAISENGEILLLNSESRIIKLDIEGNLIEIVELETLEYLESQDRENIVILTNGNYCIIEINLHVRIYDKNFKLIDYGFFEINNQSFIDEFMPINVIKAEHLLNGNFLLRFYHGIVIFDENRKYITHINLPSCTGIFKITKNLFIAFVQHKIVVIDNNYKVIDIFNFFNYDNEIFKLNAIGECVILKINNILYLYFIQTNYLIIYNFNKNSADTTIHDVLNNIDYNPMVKQNPIILKYLEKSNEKIFDFIENINYYSSDLNKQILSESTKKYNIFDTLFVNKKIILQNYMVPFFIFENIINKEKDRGVDFGGLTRTVFTLLTANLSKSIYFKEDPDTKLFKLNSFTEDKLLSNQNKEKIYFLGQLFGLAIKLKQIIQINLDPILLYQLTHNLDIENITKDKVVEIISNYDKNLLDTIPYLCFNLNTDTLETSTNLNSNPSIQSCLYNSEGESIQLSNMMEETIKKITDELKEKQNVIELFISGFRTQISLIQSKINRLPLNLLDQMIAGLKVMNFTTFFNNVKFYNFNQKQKKILIEIIKNHMCLNVQTEYISILLMAMTGSNRIPANGYPSSQPLRFEMRKIENNLPIEIHTCFNQFIINTRLVDEYECECIRGSSDPKQSELYKIFQIETLRQIKADFSSA